MRVKKVSQNKNAHGEKREEIKSVYKFTELWKKDAEHAFVRT